VPWQNNESRLRGRLANSLHLEFSQASFTAMMNSPNVNAFVA
jgi:hypothetical protein